jgi:hypothetical protein
MFEKVLDALHRSSRGFGVHHKPVERRTAAK